MNVYSIDIQLAGTVYVKADSEDEALALAQKRMDVDDSGFGIAIEVDSDPMISGLQYDDPDLPEVSISPAMTVRGVTPLVELVEECLPRA